MFRSISVTLITRILVTLTGFIAVVLNARVTGANGVGTIGLIILAISMIQLLNNVVGGGALVYLVPRTEISLLLLPSYLWSVLTALAGASLLSLFSLIPDGFFWHVVLLSMLQSGVSVNLSILVGKENYYTYNVLSIIQSFIMLSILIILYFVVKFIDITSYIYALYASYSIVYFISYMYLKPDYSKLNIKDIKKIIKKITTFGIYVQIASIFQLLSSRLSYYFIEIFLNRAALGIFTIGTQLSESIWLVGKSIATVQYSKISNSKDKNYAVRITLLFIKISLVVSIALLLLLLALPDSIFTFVFTGDFVGVRNIIFALAISTLSVSVSVIFSHYFSGIGKPIYNMIASGIGCMITMITGYFLVPAFGLLGAGATVSLASLGAVLFQFVAFQVSTQTKVRDFLFTKMDIELIRKEFRGLIKGR